MSHSMRKRTFWHVRPTQTHISLRIRAIWSESSMSVWRNFAFMAIQNASSEDSDQTVRMRRLIWIFTVQIRPKVRWISLLDVGVSKLCRNNTNGANIKQIEWLIYDQLNLVYTICSSPRVYCGPRLNWHYRKETYSSTKTINPPVSMAIQSKIILGRLQIQAEDIIDEEQASFRAGRSATEQIYNH